ncbi:MAG: tripartite tricarboxylate transporter substrate-binding protein [Burkholderiales bacterium]
MVRPTASSVFAALLALASIAASGQEIYPVKPVRLVVATPGSPQDIVARIVSPRLAELWKQAVTVENRSGAGSLMSIQTIVKAAPDGYSILIASSSYAVTPALYPEARFDADKDLVPIALLAVSPIVIVGAPSLNPLSLQDLIERSRKGEKLQFGSPGHGTAPALLLEYLMKVLAKVDILHVPYKGVVAPMTATSIGEVAIAGSGIASAMPFIKSGKVKPLALASATRWSGLPDVPTLAEAGFTGLEDQQWIGVWVPAKTPASLVDRLTEDFGRAVRDADVVTRLSGVGYEIGMMKRDAFAAYVRAEVTKWARIAKETGAKAE